MPPKVDPRELELNQAKAKVALKVLYIEQLGLSTAFAVGFFPGLCLLHKFAGVVQGGLAILRAGKHNSEFRNPRLALESLEHAQQPSGSRCILIGILPHAFVPVDNRQRLNSSCHRRVNRHTVQLQFFDHCM